MEPYTVAIDPGAKTGVALFYGRSLVGAFACEHGPAAFARLRHVITGGVLACVAFERPVFRRSGTVRSTPDDLVTLALRAGLTVGPFLSVLSGELREVRPEQWKGQLPKSVCHSRTFASLRPDEIAHWPESPDARDAVGLGMYVVQRRS